jgi:hypothetical protein
MTWGIKFRPTKPGSPHLTGNVERTQRADLELLGLAPASYGSWRAIADRSGLRTDNNHPSAEVVYAAYDPAKERIRVASYITNKTLARVKSSHQTLHIL